MALLAVGGGFFTGRYSQAGEEVETGARFDPNRFQGQNYRKRYDIFMLIILQSLIKHPATGMNLISRLWK